MSLLRNERDNSINFQKASFTLEGCVKIWTSRVDSVGTETGKLLSNLADEVRGARPENSDQPEEEGETQRAKKSRVSVHLNTYC
jgi:condensin complex subunit 2